MKNKLFILLFICNIFPQVTPYHLPYSIEIFPKKMSTKKIDYNNEISIDFIENAQLTSDSDFNIYRLNILFEKEMSGFLDIRNWHVPEGAMLFIFNNDNSYTGPYLEKQGDRFISGRFNSDNITLEYTVPANRAFEGNFIIRDVLSDSDTSSHRLDIYKKYDMYSAFQRPVIMVTGYWPPTNEMVRHFSQSLALNPSGWKGENWEELGYDVVSYFPEFDPANCNNCGQGYGDLEVDYQDFSGDYWPIIETIKPVGIITFSRGFNDESWELENRLVNRTNWYDDYTAPLLPTPNPPDGTVSNYHVRYNSLPVDDIINAVFNAHLGLDVYLDNTNAGMFLSEFAGYHGVWYKENYESDSNRPCFAAGHIHVGAQIDWATAKEAAEISIRTLIEYVDQYIILQGDCNDDGEINVLDVVALTNHILGYISFTSQQEQASDMDNNNILNVLDIIALVNLIISS